MTVFVTHRFRRVGRASTAERIGQATREDVDQANSPLLSSDLPRQVRLYTVVHKDAER